MSEIWNEVRRLVPGLIDHTERGLLQWFRTDFSNKYAARLGSGKVYVYPDTVDVRGEDGEHEETLDSWVVSLENEDGLNIGRFHFTANQPKEYEMLAKLSEDVEESLTKKKRTVLSMLEQLGIGKQE